ncbi:DAR GTPase [Actinidia chinensis var. chinensis]|uniref:DAR GTPase n=1 Tax=Actinidia chinensis var. chinensis TaxID=1590841 RepID=A0A2R6QE33_ACTCC|nr:DAR GTPase [Actinidia chinensis var. chinensis]
MASQPRNSRASSSTPELNASAGCRGGLFAFISGYNSGKSSIEHLNIAWLRSFRAVPIPVYWYNYDTLLIVGGKTAGWYGNGNYNSSNSLDVYRGENYWFDLDADLYHWTKTLRPVQWYPGHIAKTEKELKEQLKLMDVVIEVRDARIPLSTSHPQVNCCAFFLESK